MYNYSKLSYQLKRKIKTFSSKTSKNQKGFQDLNLSLCLKCFMDY